MGKGATDCIKLMKMVACRLWNDTIYDQANCNTEDVNSGMVETFSGLPFFINVKKQT